MLVAFEVTPGITNIIDSTRTEFMDGKPVIPIVSDPLSAPALAATCHGCTRTNGKLTLDGINDYIQPPSAAMEIAGWDQATLYFQVNYCTPKTAPSGNQCVAIIGVDVNNYIRLMHYNTKALVFEYKAGGTVTYSTIVSAGNVANDTCYRTAARVTGGSVYGILNGAQTDSDVYGGTWAGTLTNTYTEFGVFAGSSLWTKGIIEAVVASFGTAPDAAGANALTTALSTTLLDEELTAGKWAWWS